MQMNEKIIWILNITKNINPKAIDSIFLFYNDK